MLNTAMSFKINFEKLFLQQSRKINTENLYLPILMKPTFLKSTGSISGEKYQ